MTRVDAMRSAPSTAAASRAPGGAAPPIAQRARDAATQFEALLLAQAFAPLAKAIGFYGDTVVASATRAMASAERGGLADRLASMVAASGAPGDRPAAGSAEPPEAHGAATTVTHRAHSGEIER